MVTVLPNTNLSHSRHVHHFPLSAWPVGGVKFSGSSRDGLVRFERGPEVERNRRLNRDGEKFLRSHGSGEREKERSAHIPASGENETDSTVEI